MQTDILFTTAGTQQRLRGILELQRANIPAMLDRDEMEAEGFLTVQHTLPLLKKMAEQAPQCIALEADRVIAYALAMPFRLRADIPILEPMFREFEHMHYGGRPLGTDRFIVGGQTCIARSERGKGLLPGLYGHMRQALSGRYEGCISEIAENNPRSLRAHEKAGFKTIHTYKDGTQNWHIVLWDWASDKYAS